MPEARVAGNAVIQRLRAKPIPLKMDERVHRLPPGGRDALRKYAGGIFLAKAGSKLCLRPGPKAGAVRRLRESALL